MITPESLFRILSDSTRLRALMLILEEGEVCVCELTFALDESQPKISRHLALMREAEVVESRREGLWMHYRIHPHLPEWSLEVLQHIFDQLIGLCPYKDDKDHLKQMKNRPERNCA